MVWDNAVVGNILHNEAYTGTLVQGKTQAVVLGKGISRIAPDEQRWKHEGKHEAIVSKEEFEMAQSVIRTIQQPEERAEHDYVFKGLVHCRNCGKSMSRNASGTYSCPRKRQDDFTGCSGLWKEEEIEKAVRDQLKAKGKQAAELLGNLKRNSFDTKAASAEIAALKRKLAEKYMACAKKEISQQDYIAFQAEVRAKTAELEGNITVTKGDNDRMEENEEMLRPLAEGVNGELTRELVQGLVESIWLGDEITVVFKVDAMMQELVG